jgi:glycosyltransferase involved in cell wall biosynthesis
MKLAVFSHKPTWTSAHSPTGYATDGGFPFQMRALSEIFDETRVVVPSVPLNGRVGEMPLWGHNFSVVPLSSPRGTGMRRKLTLSLWLLRNAPVIVREVLKADAIHAPIPGDIGTIGMLLAFLLRKPLFVRHCGNWFVQVTTAEKFWKWFMEKSAGGRNVMLTTGGDSSPPSAVNNNIEWIFSTSLSAHELMKCSIERQLNDKHSVRLIIVCRQDQEKGTGVVLESLPLLLSEYPGIHCDVVGDGDDLSKFKEFAAANGLIEHVTFHGRIDHDGVVELLQMADLFCYPTRASEGFPKVVLEALACGLPVITTSVSVLPQLIKNGCGVLLDEATPAAVANAVKVCLNDPKRYSQMSLKALATARNFSLERWRDLIRDHLEPVWGTLKSHD